MTLPIFQRTITDEAGNVIPNATVEVRLESTGLLATIYDDRAGGAGDTITNPLTTLDDGFAQFYAAGGDYRIKATDPASGDVREWRYVPIWSPDSDSTTTSTGPQPLAGAFDDRVVRATSIADMKTKDASVGQIIELASGGRSGTFEVKSGTPPSDPQEGIYVVLANGNYAERTKVTALEPRFYGLNNQDQIQAEAASDGIQYTHVSYGRFELINGRDDAEGIFDAPNFAGQTNYGSEPIGFVFHHYTDGTMIQVDNVGEGNDILLLKNAQNSTRRPDKAANFVGDGNFINLKYHSNVTGGPKSAFFIDKDARFIWTGEKGLATLLQNKPEDATYAMQLETTNPHEYIFRFKNGANVVGSFENDVSYTRFAIKSTVNQINGMYIQAQAGNLLLDSADQIHALVPIGSSSGDLTLTAKTASDVVQAARPLGLPRYADAASAPTFPGTKNGAMAFNNATNRPMFWNGSGWTDL